MNDHLGRRDRDEDDDEADNARALTDEPGEDHRLWHDPEVEDEAAGDVNDGDDQEHDVDPIAVEVEKSDVDVGGLGRQDDDGTDESGESDASSEEGDELNPQLHGDETTASFHVGADDQIKEVWIFTSSRLGISPSKIELKINNRRLVEPR